MDHMKRLILFFFLLVVGFVSCTKDVQCEPCPAYLEISEEENLGYDSLYAAELGADEWGMKVYTMAFLKSGPNEDLDSAESAALQRAHLDNINKMAEEGKLVLAGPFDHDGELRGIYIFDATLEEAEELTNSAPAVQAGSLVMELIPWYGSAAIMEVNAIHQKIAKTNI